MLLDRRHTYKPFMYPWCYEVWNKHERMHWMPHEVPLGDDVIDWSNHLTASQKEFLTQLFRFFTQADVSVADGYASKFLPMFSGHPEVTMMLLSFGARECYDKNTEILTDEGWKLFSELTRKEKVAQYNIDTQQVSFVIPSDFVVRDYQGIMHHYHNSTTDICVTPKHRLVLKHPSSGKIKFDESENGRWGRNYLYPVTGFSSFKDGGLTHWDRLLIAIQADGTLRGNCPNYRNGQSQTVDFHVKKARKVERLRELLNLCGLNCNPRLQEDGFTKFTFTLPEDMNIKNIKNFSWVNLAELSSDTAADFIEEVLFWDGSVTETTRAYYNTNESAIDVVQAVACLAGISCHKSINRSGDVVYILDNPKPSNTKTCWVLTFSDHVFRTYPHRVEVPYNDKVYCVTVPDGAVITRRNNRVSICGNCVHIAAYALLIETVGMPETEYSAFLDYKAMKDKYEYISEINTDSKVDIAKALAVYSAFTEGMQLFSSFAMLMHFERLGRMKGMTNIVRWSLRDEGLHAESMIRIFRTFCREYMTPADMEATSHEVRKIAEKMVELEDKFIDLAFSQVKDDLNLGLPPSEKPLTKDELHLYIRHVTDYRLRELGFDPIYGEPANPIPWLDRLLLAPEHTNFFEGKPTEYAKGGLQGDIDYDD